jgi:hypothetical protein
MTQLQHKKATTIHQTRENGKVGSIMLAQFATTRKQQMPSNGRDIAWLKVMTQLQHKKSTTIHQKREDGKVGSIMLAQFATTRKQQMPSNVQ